LLVEYVRQKEEDLHKDSIQPGERYCLIYSTEEDWTSRDWQGRTKSRWKGFIESCQE